MFHQGSLQLTDEPAIAEGLQRILTHDPVLKASGITPAQMGWPRLQPGFAGMLAVILAQQISFKVADQLWQRLYNELNALIAPEAFIELPEAVRQRCGFSRQKDAYACNLARDIMQGRINLRELDNLNDEDAMQMLTGIHGIGEWSAQLYLMFALARPDIWPAGDLGIQMGVKHYHEMDERPGISATHTAGELFKPYRTAGALLMWELKRRNEG
jgi:DNA-3-methyladenine glycosylase II